jgi:hypothetical protein
MSDHGQYCQCRACVDKRKLIEFKYIGRCKNCGEKESWSVVRDQNIKLFYKIIMDKKLETFHHYCSTCKMNGVFELTAFEEMDG